MVQPVRHVARVLDELEQQSRRVPEPDELLAETLLDAAVVDGVPLQVVSPERERVLRHDVGRRLDLPRPDASRHPLVREGGHHRSDFRVRVRVIQVVMRVAAVEQHGLLDQPVTDDLRHEVEIFLGAADAYRDVVNASDETCHWDALPSCCVRTSFGPGQKPGELWSAAIAGRSRCLRSACVPQRPGCALQLLANDPRTLHERFELGERSGAGGTSSRSPARAPDARG